MPFKHACYAQLSRYINRLKTVRRTFPCPLCEVSLRASEFESHCLANHGLEPKLCCVWCLGEHEWSPGRKNLYSDHLLECFFKFISSLPPPASGETFPVPGKESNDASLGNDGSVKVERLDAEVERRESENRNLRNEVERLKNLAEDRLGDCREAREEIARLRAENDRLETESRDARDRLESVESDELSLRGRIHALETENENVGRKVRRLEAEKGEEEDRRRESLERKREEVERLERETEEKDRIIERLRKKMERRKKKGGPRLQIDTVNVYGTA